MRSDMIKELEETLHLFNDGAVVEILGILSEDEQDFKLALVAGADKAKDTFFDLEATRKMITIVSGKVRH